MVNEVQNLFRREVSRFFGGSLAYGGRWNKPCDVYTDTLLIECKLRKKWPTPKEMLDWLSRLEARAIAENKGSRLCIRIGGCHGFWIVADAIKPIMWHSSWCENEQ